METTHSANSNNTQHSHSRSSSVDPSHSITFKQQIGNNFSGNKKIEESSSKRPDDSNKFILTDSHFINGLKEIDVYENDEYNFNCFKSKLSPTLMNSATETQDNVGPKKTSVLNENKSLQNEDFMSSTYVYYYTDKDCYNRIFETRKIECEPMIYENELIDAIIFLTLPPETCDKELLTILYGPNSPVSWTKVQCCIQIRSSSLMNFKDRLIKISDCKYAFKKNIKFTTVFPKHQFRPNYKPIH
jgi:hypothetical protein